MSDENLLELTRRETAELRLAEQLRAALKQRAAFELEVLNSRDHAMGRAAEIGELRYRLVKQAALYERRQSDFAVHDANHRSHIARLEAAMSTLAVHDANHRSHIARLEAAMSTHEREVASLEREVASLRNSTTWRLGRLLMSPVRAVKRLLRRS